MLRICSFFVLTCLPIAALAGLANPPEAHGPTGTLQVIDADTWDVGGTRVRLFGIDAPELDQSCTRPNGATWACGAWATQQTRDRYSGQTAQCDAIDTDRYGRTVARCFVDGQDVGAAMVADGLALAFGRYSQDYVGIHKTAQLARVGLHAVLMQQPSQFRAARRAASAGQGGACKIKGNISAKGQ